MAYRIYFRHKETQVCYPVEGREFRYVDKGFAESEARRFNNTDNPAWKGTFYVVPIGFDT